MIRQDWLKQVDMLISDQTVHEPVLFSEVVEAIVVGTGGTYVDGTLGGGGHAKGVLDRAGEGAVLLGIDRDAAAIERAGKLLEECVGESVLVHGSFSDMARIAMESGLGPVDGVVLDLGISSDQLDTAERGFSFSNDGPLDMRMDCGGDGPTAADPVKNLSEERLKEILRVYGEERHAGRIARAIVEERGKGAIETTWQLAAVVESVVGRRGKRHPATKTFQGLRIAVNDELGELGRGLEEGLDLLAYGGRMAVIAFHSLEDRMVKRFFRAHAGVMEAQQAGGSRWVGELPAVIDVSRKAIKAGKSEVQRNSRSRSARLRVVEKIRVSGNN